MKTLNKWTIAVLALALLATFTPTDADEKAATVVQDAVVQDAVETPAKASDETIPDDSYKSAATVDFAAELGLDFPSLISLGARIERFRSTSPDPFGLASAARELAAAEKLSGGNASITAEQIIAEAIELAKVRNNSTELKAVAAIVEDEKTHQELTDLATRAARAEKKRSDQVKAGVVTRGIEHELIIDNDSHQRIAVYYNRRYQGSVKPHSHGHFRVHDHSPHFDLYARGSNGSIWKRHLHGNFKRYTWKIRSRRKPIVRLPSRVRNLHTHVKGHHIDVEWGRATNAVSYEMQVYDKTAGRALRHLWKRGIRKTEIHLDVKLHNRTYQIFVRGINARGLPNDRTSLWSRTEVFVK